MHGGVPLAVDDHPFRILVSCHWGVLWFVRLLARSVYIKFLIFAWPVLLFGVSCFSHPWSHPGRRLLLSCRFSRFEGTFPARVFRSGDFSW